MFTPLLALENQDTEIAALINSFNTVVTETANNILGKHRPAKKPWVTDNILKPCVKRKRWEDSIKEWTGLEWNIILRKAENREEWRKLVVKSTVVPQRSARLRDR